METKMRFRLSFIAILILVILNLGLLGVFWYDRFQRESPAQDAHRNPEEFFIGELRLDQAQADSVRALRRAHFAYTDSLKREMNRLNAQMMEELFMPSPDTSRVRQLSAQIGNLQAEFERKVYEHFSQVKRVLQPGQYPKLQLLLHDALKKRAAETESNERPGQSGPDQSKWDGSENHRPPPPKDNRPPRPDDRGGARPRDDSGNQPPRDNPRPTGG